MLPSEQKERTMPEAIDPVITISLLDPVAGYAAQSWEFENASVIRFGREETNDVVISDASVSRVHGELTRSEAGWSVTALGRNGIVVHGRAITGATAVSHETVLRLAASGPYLEFRFGRRRNTLAERLDEEKRWADTREREEERQRSDRTDVTELDFKNPLERRKPAK
jgi:pSer/pThr/pTyr-binding forkhead associated (FHA) protein